MERFILRHMIKTRKRRKDPIVYGCKICLGALVGNAIQLGQGAMPGWD